MEINDVVTIRGTIIRKQEGVLTVRLEDGFALAEVPVQPDHVAPV